MSSTSDYMRYTAPRQRSLTTLRTTLPDISEHTYPTSRTPTPPFRRPSNHLRSVSVASFHSDGTIEIDGFGFDNMSEIGDDASIFGGESVYADSVFDPDDAPNPRPHTPGDLSWRAERILANAKKKLDLCGQNISRARSSLILSPSTTPTSFNEQLNGVRAMPAFHSQRFRMRNEVVGNGNGASNGGGSAHVRASSESAVMKSRRSGMIGGEGGLIGLGLGTIADEDERSHITEQTTGHTTGPSRSTQQMRALRDQMKDLRGKITSLQEQAKTDSMRRLSISSLRSTPTPYDSHTPMDDLKYHSDSPQETWESAEESPDEDEYASTVSSGTPRAYRRSVSPFSPTRHEDREDAFSYDALFYGNGIYANGANGRPISYGSDGTESTTTAILEPTPHFKRRDSFDSINSFATAAEDRTSSTESLRRKAAGQNHHPTPSPEWLATPTLRDDGYHSAPHTPKNLGYKDYSPSAGHKPAAKPYPIHPSPTQDAPTSIDAVVTAATRGKINRKSVITLGSAESMLLTSDGEIRLQLSNSDRELIENMIEGLGEVCCSMEMEQEPVRRSEYRRRLEGALKVLRGEVVVGSQRPEPAPTALKRERSVGANWGGRYRGSSGYRAAEEWMGETDDECF
ncbi:uncharacterized protein LAJ45_07335 [Morchella importuna]|uniref:uncharacterized protein n=1 Tax=Morchella importuna TaxID=1174673 RepID=UPI001E8EC9B3|nr:uncharacterized protein LAJ45_07335 [Morchella importuna]KAH8148624.1 hypothetical protein LAJ45_07335 [Morchella importuna]